MDSNWGSYWEEESGKDYWRQPDAAIVRLKDSLDEAKVKDVLDLGCGIGRHALLFAEAGFEVTAVDSSQEALDILQQNSCAKEMHIVKGNYSDDLFLAESFDLVIAYNVLYHGSRQAFKGAVNLVHKWLRPGGLFFFTCPTRRDEKYGNGDKVAENTWASSNSVHPGDVHYFADENDITDFLAGFKSFSKSTDEHYWDNKGSRQFSSQWRILADK